MNDKKEYTKLLVILNTIATPGNRMNKLTKLTIETQDPQLRELGQKIVESLRANGAPDSLPSYINALSRQPTTTVSQSNLMKTYHKVVTDCNAAIASVEPQWQRIARAAGWTPPL